MISQIIFRLLVSLAIGNCLLIYLPFSKSCCSTIDECFDRSYPFIFYPLPECPVGENEPIYELFTRKNTDKPVRFKLENLPLSSSQSRPKVYFMVHGWGDSPEYDKLVHIKNSLLEKDDANVILVDWQKLSDDSFYPYSASNTRTTGAHLAKVIRKIRSERKAYIWCIGHSLGAQVCGHAGKRSKIDRITAIEPAGPGFQEYPASSIGVSTGDAAFVDVIHTNDIKGTHKSLGDADFYANGGRRQPACYETDYSCQHAVGLDYFNESIKRKCFKSQKCSSIYLFWLWFTCEESDQHMGYDANPEKHGYFYVDVKAKSPYCANY